MPSAARIAPTRECEGKGREADKKGRRSLELTPAKETLGEFQ